MLDCAPMNYSVFGSRIRTSSGVGFSNPNGKTKASLRYVLMCQRMVDRLFWMRGKNRGVVRRRRAVIWRRWLRNSGRHAKRLAGRHPSCSTVLDMRLARQFRRTLGTWRWWWRWWGTPMSEQRCATSTQFPIRCAKPSISVNLHHNSRHSELGCNEAGR